MVLDSVLRGRGRAVVVCWALGDRSNCNFYPSDGEGERGGVGRQAQRRWSASRFWFRVRSGGSHTVGLKKGQGGRRRARVRGAEKARGRALSTERTILSPFTKEYRALGATTGIVTVFGLPRSRGPTDGNHEAGPRGHMRVGLMDCWIVGLCV